MAKTKRDNDWGWPIIIGLFIFGLWPIALMALFAKLFGSDNKRRQEQAPPLQGDIRQTWQAQQTRNVRQAQQAREPRQAAQAGQRVNHSQNKATSAVKRAMKSPSNKKSTAEWLKIGGVILLVVGMLAMFDASGSAAFWGLGDIEFWLEDLLSGLAFAVGGGAMLFSGISMGRSLKRYSKYLLVMGDREAMPIEELARTLGYTEKRVEKDLQKMIDKGYFGGKAYLNMELGYIFRTSNADSEFRQKQQAAQAAEQTPKEAEEGYSGILRNIRRANDRIADPVLSAKINRLEDITAKIFKAVEDDPRKRSRIDTFLNYYLPTTQKLLNSYAEFEAAGVEGENLKQAKQRIESTMDSIVKGFEHQLDELYKTDAMDVDTDIRVMESMLRRDTGSVSDDFGLGE